jgi:hypothetical protein
LGAGPDEGVDVAYAPSMANASGSTDERGPSLDHWMLTIAREEYGYVPKRNQAQTLEDRRDGNQRYRDEFRKATEESGFRVVHKELYCVLTTPESASGWYSIPIFRRNVLPTLDSETSGRVLEAAYARWRPTATDGKASLMNMVLERMIR